MLNESNRLELFYLCNKYIEGEGLQLGAIKSKVDKAEEEQRLGRVDNTGLLPGAPILVEQDSRQFKL